MIIFGAGSYSKILYLSFKNIFKECKINFLIDPFEILKNEEIIFWRDQGFEIISTFKKILENKLVDIKFVVAIGNEFGYERTILINELKKRNIYHEKFIHQSANISEDSYISNESVIMPNVTIMPLCTIKKGAIINTSATIDHEVQIDEGCHVMGSSYIAGRVNIGQWSTIGANCTIFPDVKIGVNCFIGAGSVVRSDIPDNSIYVGNPSKFLKKSRKLPDLNQVKSRNKLL